MKLRPYQEYASQQIIGNPACALFMDMGLGKSSTTLSAIDYLVNETLEVGKVLVIAPLRVAETTWTDEIEKWGFNLTVSAVLGSKEKRIKALSVQADIYTINRENVVWLVEFYGTSWPFDMVVIDESSGFKNPSAKRFSALRRIRPKIKRLVELTGTPAPNGLMDLWSQLYLLDRGERLGKTISEYRRRWFYPGAGYGHVVYEWLPKDNAKEDIYKQISDICISMKSDDYLSLPPVMYNPVKVPLGKSVMVEYKRFERDLVLSMPESDIVATTAATLSNKVLQFANGSCYDENGEVVQIHEKKLDALEEICESNANLMVFYWFRHDLIMIKTRFPNACELRTAQDIRDWNAGKINMILVHPASAGHGLNLQEGGNVAVWYSQIWSLELFQQANKRLHRSGQKKPVIIHQLIAEGTIDEDVVRALDGKKIGQDGLMEAIKARIREYSN